MLEARQANESQEVAGVRMRAPSVASHLQRKPHVAEHVEPGQQHRVLEHEAEESPFARHVRGLAMDQHAAAGRRLEIGDDAKERRFAAATRADERDQLALLDLKADIGERYKRAVVEVECLREVVDADRALTGRCGRRGYDPFAANSKMEVFMTSAAVMGLSI